jgi:hypothetical protein
VERLLTRKTLKGHSALPMTIMTLLLTAVAAPLSAAELIMFENKGCSYCRRWLAEVGPSYPKTDEGKRAPLRRMDIRAELPKGLMIDRPITVTPTFVLVEEHREVGRLTGYAGAEFFYELLADVMAKLPPNAEGAGNGRP